jgi:hypothetical protein
MPGAIFLVASIVLFVLSKLSGGPLHLLGEEKDLVFGTKTVTSI